MSVNLTMDNHLLKEMSGINMNLKSYSGYETIATSLSKLIPPQLVAGLIGCIIPESGTNHKILNKREYIGNGANGTEGWHCGEGLVQWTFWKYKEPLIKKYNADSRSRQKLPETWSEYCKGQPKSEGNLLVSKQDGKHISGLSIDDQMLMLVIYYNDVIKKLENEENIAVITAKIYQQKAGIGFYRNISDPIERAYTTSKNKYPSSSGNHFLKSLKMAQQYYDESVSNVNEMTDDYGLLSTPNGSSFSSQNFNGVYRFMETEKDVPFSGMLLGSYMRQM